MKVLRVHIENFKCIDNLDVDLNGASIMLVGDNGVGKSSFLQAIEIAFGMNKNIPSEPLKKGMEEGVIQVLTGDNGKKYEFSVRMRKGKNPVISVTTDGLKSTQKGIISQIVGGEDFDIFKFVEMSNTSKGRREQVEIVKTFLPKEILEAIEKLKSQVQANFELRTSVNRDIKTYEGFIASSGMLESEISQYSEEVEINSIQEDYKKAIDFNNKLAGIDSRIEEREGLIASKREAIASVEAQIRDLEALKEKLQSDIKENEKLNEEATAYLLKTKEIDITVFQEKLKEAQEFNKKVAKATDLKSKVEKVKELRDQSENLTILIDSSKAQIESFIRDNPLPVEGLEFNDELLLWNGLEVNESTLSTSELMLIGLRLKMARNPKSKVLTIARTESIGKEKRKQLIDFANKYDFQLIMEKVDEDVDKLQIEFVKE